MPVNRAPATSRAPAEHGTARPTFWQTFRRSQRSPNRMTSIAKAVVHPGEAGLKMLDDPSVDVLAEGVRVRVLKDPEGDGPWRKGFLGSITHSPRAPEPVNNSQALPDELAYWVDFDEPQYDANGAGPYGKAQIWGRYLVPLQNDDLQSVSRDRCLESGRRLAVVVKDMERVGDTEQAAAVHQQLRKLIERYRALLPDVVVARCPASDEIVRFPVDTVDLDGWFWDYDAPIRRKPDVPDGWLAVTGAMSLGEPVGKAPVRRRPGPGLPYVIPRILSCPDVRAVLSAVEVGPHVGYTISYFGKVPTRIPLENTWGTKEYQVYNSGAWQGWNSHESDLSEFDFDLTHWVAAKKLLWLAPGDADSVLRTSVADCPFFGLVGSRQKASITRGVIRRYG